jgi:ATP-dependent exoDNAse (exonuclease V) beta subunit (contains helicase and exonuclease domains)
MTEFDPNSDQQRLIQNTEGIYLVNAGAGTGKTFTITRRYVNILDQPAVEPDDILLVTFTRNAAGEMANRIARNSVYDPVQLQDAPISTFHAYCYRLLRRYGYDTPSEIGIKTELPDSLDLIEDSVREATLFREFVSRFQDAHPEHKEIFAAMDSPAALNSLISELASKGVIPRRDGWYRGTGTVLEGDKEAFMQTFAEQNEPNQGSRGPTQSDARRSLSGWEDDAHVPSAPPSDSLLREHTVDVRAVERAFDEDRTQLEDFVHDVYFEYLEYAIDRNYLTQSLMLAMAFVMLCENEGVRQEVSHRYVMVDEFQDTNELQFKLSLLLAAENNICAVGDWKQSIYGFQYTDIENIQSFRDRLDRFETELNADRERIGYDVTDVTEIPLRQNYRSTESILSAAKDTLQVPATKREDLDTEHIEEAFTPLEATNHVDNSQLGAYTHGDELELIVDRIEHIVRNPDYAVETDTEPQETPDMSHTEAAAAERERLGKPSYGDIAVFTRTRSFARDLLETADEHNIPVAYEGGIELFDTDQAKLLLAWLRIVETGSDRGWAVVLEETGYTLPAAETILESANFPDEMVAFRDELDESTTIGGFARRVFDAYGYNGPRADGLVEELTGAFESTLTTRSEAISFVESNLEAGTTVEIDSNPGEDSVTLQTIHSAKGLEYPIVILGNVNRHGFPQSDRASSGVIRYADPIGIRQSRRYSTASGRPHVYSHWAYDVLNKTLPSEYDEERRLFYVAVTRAKRHLLLTAGESPSQFFTEFPLESESVVPDFESNSPATQTTDTFSVTPADRESPNRMSVHELIDDSVFQQGEAGRGPEFGDQVHDFAEAYADGDAVTPDSDDGESIRALLDRLSGTFETETTAILPLSGTPQITLVGVIDLFVVSDDRVSIVDYKTDLTRRAHSEYRKQLSVYYHAAKERYSDRMVTASILYTADDDLVEITPLDLPALREIASESR